MSEVARLRELIAEECEANWQALHGVASGMARHGFIRARLKNMDACHTRLREMVGEEEALAILWEVYNEKASKQ